jgi:hypothetical protein
MFWAFSLITVQALVGGLDNLWHHELTERLPARRAAAGELALHSARELIYSFVFIALAWFRWQGYCVMLIVLALFLEIVITLADFVVEDRTRRLPAFERVLHTVLAVNFGAALAALTPVFAEWWGMRSGIVVVSHGMFSWIFTFLSAGVFVWSARNAFAVLTLRRPPEWVRDPIMAGSSAALGFRFRYPDVRRALMSLLRDPTAALEAGAKRRIRRHAMVSDTQVRAHRRVTWW